jgi:hypothetical protein
MLSAFVYCLCAAASATCALALFRLFWQRGRVGSRLALWTSLSFAGFAVSNALVVADLIIWPSVQLAVARAATACAAAALLLFGLIWEVE